MTLCTRPAAPRLRCDRGFTLIELVIYVALAAVVIVGPMAFIVASVRQQNTVASRTSAARQAEGGLERMVRDLRQAMAQDGAGDPLAVAISQPTPASVAISFDIPTPGSATVPQLVTWTCPSTGATAAGACTRRVGSGPAVEDITGVSAAAIVPTDATGRTMTLPASDPAYLGVTLTLQPTSQLDPGATHTVAGIQNPITLQTGVDLRNFA